MLIGGDISIEIVEGGFHLLKKTLEREKGIKVFFVSDDDENILEDLDSDIDKFIILLER